MLRGAVCIARVGETRVDETRGWVDEGGLVDERRGAVRLQGSSDPGGPRQRGKRGKRGTAKSCSASGFKQPWRAVAMRGGGGAWRRILHGMFRRQALEWTQSFHFRTGALTNVLGGSRYLDRI